MHYAPPIETAAAIDAITVENLAAAVQVSRTTLYNAINDGSLPSFIFGGRRMVRISAWKEHCARLEQETELPKDRLSHVRGRPRANRPAVIDTVRKDSQP